MAEHKRAMGFWRTWGMSVGMMIGSGVFMLPTVLAPYGKYAVYSWLISGGGTIALALSLAYMARRVTKNGGPYAYTQAAFGDFAGFLVAWGYWISVWISVAAVTVAFLGYLTQFIPLLETSATTALSVGLTLIWILVLVNCRSVKGSSSFQLATTLAKIFPLFLFASIGVFNVDNVNYQSMIVPENGLSATAAASALTLWAFIGFELATIPSGEVQNPTKTIPRATVISVLAVGTLYFAVTVTAFGLLPAGVLLGSTAPLADAASVLGGADLGILVTIVALIATGSSVNASLFATGQMPMAAALDGLFPAKFGKLNDRGTPSFSYVLGGLLASLALAMNFVDGLIAAFQFLILLATITVLVPYAFSSAAAWLYSLREAETNRLSHMGHGLLMTIGFGYAVWAIAGTGQESVYWGFIMLLAGVPVYVWITRRKNSSPADEVSQ